MNAYPTAVRVVDPSDTGLIYHRRVAAADTVDLTGTALAALIADGDPRDKAILTRGCRNIGFMFWGGHASTPNNATYKITIAGIARRQTAEDASRPYGRRWFTADLVVGNFVSLDAVNPFNGDAEAGLLINPVDTITPTNDASAAEPLCSYKRYGGSGADQQALLIVDAMGLEALHCYVHNLGSGVTAFVGAWRMG